MREISVGTVEEFADPGRKVVAIGAVEIGVFRLGDAFYAYENVCPHMAGPACQGKMIAKVEEMIAEGGASLGLAFSKTQLNVVCPWHGYEFDIRTGHHAGHDRVRLRPIAVAVVDGAVVLSLPANLERRVAAAIEGAAGGEETRTSL